MELTFEQLLELARQGVNIHLYLSPSGSIAIPSNPPPDDELILYTVDTSGDPDKHNNRVKIFATAGKGGSEIGFALDGDTVKGPGYTVGEFTMIKVPFQGFIETRYLKRQ